MDSQAIGIKTQAFGNQKVGITRLRLQESIGRPFSLRIEFVSPSPEIDIESVLGQSITVTIHGPGGSKNINGIFDSFEQSSSPKNALPGEFYFIGEIRPALYDLSYGQSCRVFVAQSLTDMVGSLLSAKSELHFDWNLSLQYPKRRYTVQYQESDLDFISRILEQEGVSYFLDDDGSTQTIRFSDHAAGFPALPHADTLDFVAASGQVPTEEAISRLTFHSEAPPAVTLDDFSPGHPQFDLETDAPKADAVSGGARLWSSGYELADGETLLQRRSTVDQRLAKVRAEETHFRNNHGLGESTVCRMTPGFTFALQGYPSRSHNTRYLITEVEHVVSVPSTVALQISTAPTASNYRNRFGIVALDEKDELVFRPQRQTPPPACYSIMQAHVEAPSNTVRPNIDQGDYKLRMPFDHSGSDKATASANMPLARPYQAPPSFQEHPAGFHFPLAPETPVVWSAIDGNPDRPVILGALPSVLRSSVFKTRSSLDYGLETPVGNRLRLHDEEAAGSPGPEADLTDYGYFEVLCEPEKSSLHGGGGEFHFDHEMTSPDAHRFFGSTIRRNRSEVMLHGFIKEAKANTAENESEGTLFVMRSETGNAEFQAGQTSEAIVSEIENNVSTAEKQGREKVEGILLGTGGKESTDDEVPEAWLMLGEADKNGILFETAEKESKLFVGDYESSSVCIVLSTEEEVVLEAHDNSGVHITSRGSIDNQKLWNGIETGEKYGLLAASTLVSWILWAAGKAATNDSFKDFLKSLNLGDLLTLGLPIFKGIRLAVPSSFNRVTLSSHHGINSFSALPIGFLSLIATGSASLVSTTATGLTNAAIGALGVPKGIDKFLLGRGGVTLASMTGGVSLNSMFTDAEVSTAKGKVTAKTKKGMINVRATLLDSATFLPECLLMLHNDNILVLSKRIVAGFVGNIGINGANVDLGGGAVIIRADDHNVEGNVDIVPPIGD